SYKENKELEALPAKIEALESEQTALIARMSEPDYFKREVSEQQADKARAEELPGLIEAAYARWEELTQKAELCAG
ncbi:MAG: ABC transporter ATP-binding protein, partial [Duodenibacillus sp.]|nr:ABC transporter ATP-binding protein [Duodenibacillus sp.]